MKTLLKWVGVLVVIILIFSIYRGTYLDIPRQEVEEKYALGESSFIILNNGARIHYRDEGNKKGPAIVLLHGFNASLFNFELLVPFLAKDFRLISLDLPAFGLTGAVPSTDYSTDTFINTVSGLTTYLGIEEFSIAGNSMGGHVAWRYALKFPEQVQGLILIAAGGIITDDDLEERNQESDESPIVWQIMDSAFIRGVLHYFTPRFFADQGLRIAIFDSKLVTDSLVDQFHELALLEGSRDAILSMTKVSDHRRSNPAILKKITSPTLVIHGAKDNLVHVENSKHYADNIPQITVKIYEEIGHMPMYEDPKRTSMDIREFLTNSLGMNYD